VLSSQFAVPNDSAAGRGNPFRTRPRYFTKAPQMRGFRRSRGADKGIQNGPWGNAWGNTRSETGRSKPCQAPPGPPTFARSPSPRGMLHRTAQASRCGSENKPNEPPARHRLGARWPATWRHGAIGDDEPPASGSEDSEGIDDEQ
jgi:hypothetical protein